MKHTVTPKFETKDGATVVMDPVTYEVVLTQGDIKTVDVETYEINQSRPVYRTDDDTRTYVCNIEGGKVTTKLTLKGLSFLPEDVQRFNMSEPVDVSVTLNDKTDVYKNLMLLSWRQTTAGTFIEEMVLRSS